ncbi:MAG: PEP-CTERM sorting domain-containing protein [Planctomyces sp.]
MMRFILTLAALLLISAPAQAGAIFDFSFQNVTGNINGIVSGKITLSGTGDGTFSATSILVNAAPAGLGYTVPLDVLSVMPLVYVNTFVVSGGQIDKNLSSYASENLSDAFTLNFGAFGSLLNIANSGSADTGVVDTTNFTLSYSTPPAAVPEPSTAFALAAVCGVIGGLRRMRRSA